MHTAAARRSSPNPDLDTSFDRRSRLAALLLLAVLAAPASTPAVPVTPPGGDAPSSHSSPWTERVEPTDPPKTVAEVDVGSIVRGWLGPDGEPLPFRTDAEVLAFLRAARVVSSEELGGTVGKPLKVRLERDGVVVDAIFRHVHETTERVRYKGHLLRTLRDDFIFEPAAYRLSRLLGLNNVPPAVTRYIGGRKGTLQLWLEGTMTASERSERGIRPPDDPRWRWQKARMRVFDNLIFNTDRNTGNFLVDGDGRIWLVDHTRAFQLSPNLRNPAEVLKIDRELLRRLRQLDEEVLKRELDSYLTIFEIRDLLARRDRLVERLDALIVERGADAVLLDPPSRAAAP